MSNGFRFGIEEGEDGRYRVFDVQLQRTVAEGLTREEALAQAFELAAEEMLR